MQPRPAQLHEDAILRWMQRPDLMVRELFGVTPDAWQDEVLQAFPTTPRIAMKAAKGPGKSCVLAWCAWNYLLTRPNPNIAATSISADNLRDALWKEMAVWQARSPLLQAAFEVKAERIYAKEFPKTWWMSARSWSQRANAEELGNTLAGVHSDYVLFLIDESGSIPVPVLMAAEAVLANAGVGSGREAHVMQAGNTTTLDGALYYACVTKRDLWKVVVVSGDPDNPKRSPRISLEWARDLIRTHGRDNPFVKVMVLGEWPSASINALLGPDEVEAAFKRKYQQHDVDHAARILGVDVAREGNDASVIFPRQGLVAFKPQVLLGVDGLRGAGQVARVWADWDVDAVFVDNTGGFGASWIDQLKNLNRAPIPVGFAEAADDPRYYNRRSEMYFRMSRWVKDGGALPEIPELVPELTQTCYTFKGDRLLIEPKDVIKAKIGRSPDRADALGLTFAAPVIRKHRDLGLGDKPQRMAAYDPYAELLRVN